MLNAFLIYIIDLLKKKTLAIFLRFQKWDKLEIKFKLPSSFPSYFPPRAFASLLKIHITFLIGSFQLVSQNLTQLDKHHIPNKVLNFCKNKKTLLKPKTWKVLYMEPDKSRIFAFINYIVDMGTVNTEHL